MDDKSFVPATQRIILKIVGFLVIGLWSSLYVNRFDIKFPEYKKRLLLRSKKVPEEDFKTFLVEQVLNPSAGSFKALQTSRA